MVGKIVVSQPVDKRLEPAHPDSLENSWQRSSEEVNLVLRYRMRSNGSVGHLSDEDDVDQVTGALIGSKLGMKALGDGAVRGVVVDVGMKRIVRVSHLRLRQRGRHAACSQIKPALHAP